MVATYHFFLSRKESYKYKVDSRGYTFERNSFTNSNKLNFIIILFFYPCSNWILSIFLSKRYLRSCSYLFNFINLRYLPLRNESTRAPSFSNIYIINPSPFPKTKSSSGAEQTMSSQEHLDFYILEKKWWM
mgnify:CR=1 FL=1